MKLHIVLAAILAVSLAREIGSKHETEDLEPEASNIELMKISKDGEKLETAPITNGEVHITHEDVEKKDEADESNADLVRKSRENKDLTSAAATYNNNYIPPSQRPPRPWNKPQINIPVQNQNYVPNIPAQNVWNNQVNVPLNPTHNNIPTQPTVQSDYQQNIPASPSNFYPTAPQNTIPQNTYPQNTVPQNTYPQNTVPQNTYPQNTIPQNTYPQNTIPQNTYPQNTIPQNTYPQNTNPQNTVPQNTYPQTTVPQNTYYPPQNNLPQNDAPQKPQNDWVYPAVIKNDQYFGDNGNYNYEYQIADGTHVGEQGWLVNPNTENESVVKKGWYSYTGADGRVYTVTWWADESGYHAFGDHLPTPPPVPAAIQAALDQAAKEEAEKNTPVYYPTTQAPAYYPTTQAPVYYPPVTQATYYPQQQYPQQQYPQQQYPQQQYPQQQQIKPGHYGK